MASSDRSSADGRIRVPDVPGVQKKRFDPSALLSGKDVRQRWMVVGAVAVVAVAGAATVMSKGSAPKQRAPTPVVAQAIETTPKGISSQADWKAQTGAELQELKRIVAEQSAGQKELLARIESLRKEAAQPRAGGAVPGATLPGRVDLSLPPPPVPPKSLQGGPVPGAPGPAVGASLSAGAAAPPPPGPSGAAVVPRSAARAFVPPGLAEERQAAAEAATVEANMVPNERAGYLPATSFAAATLISGVEAFTGGTAQAQPQPLVIRVDENAILPNAARYDIKGCHVLASVYGDMSSERVFGRLATLTCVNAEGKLVLSEVVEGNLIDSDGKNGIRGDLQDRQGAKLARSLLAGFAQGMASAFGTAQGSATTGILTGLTTTTISGKNAAAAAGYSGAETAAQTLADFYLKQAEATMPIIAVDAGRKISVLFTKSVSLKFESTANYRNKPKAVVVVDREVQ